MRLFWLLSWGCLVFAVPALAEEPAKLDFAEETPGAELVYPEYEDAKVVFDFYLDDPAKMGSALYWIRALVNPLMASPYEQSMDFMEIKVIIHGTEIVTLAKKNYEKYRDAVERMRYYSMFGIEFRVCGMAADDYGYRPEDLQDFVKIAPSAMTELAHWQRQGYALIQPIVRARKNSIEEIR